MAVNLLGWILWGLASRAHEWRPGDTPESRADLVRDAWVRFWACCGLLLVIAVMQVVERL